jgi:hypothetical protein
MVFKMLHLPILDGTIIREASTLHKVHKASIANMGISNIELGNFDESKQIDDLAALDTMETLDSTTRSNLWDFIDKVFLKIKSITIHFLILQTHLLSTLKVVKGKQQDMIARSVVGLDHPNTTPLFPSIVGDNALKRHKGMLEFLAQKQNPLKNQATKYICI